MQTTLKVIIREARESDAPALVGLCEQLGYPVQIGALKRHLSTILSDTSRQALLAADLPGTGVVGWVHVHIVDFLGGDSFVEIGGLVVDAGHRRCGAGRALMQAAEAWARTRGINTIRLRSNTVRSEAHQFYKDLGYTLNKTQYTFQKECGANFPPESVNEPNM